MSSSERPLAEISAGQWRGGMARDCRHLRMASVPTPQSEAAAAAQSYLAQLQN